MDTSSIRLPPTCGAIKGEPSTHGHNPTDVEDVGGQNRNISTIQVGFEGVAEPRGNRKEARRTTEMRELTDEEMVRAYDELEREMREPRKKG